MYFKDPQYEHLPDRLFDKFVVQQVIDRSFKQEIRGWPNGDWRAKIDNLLDELVRGGDVQTYDILKDTLRFFSSSDDRELLGMIEKKEENVKVSSSASC